MGTIFKYCTPVSQVYNILYYMKAAYSLHDLQGSQNLQIYSPRR